MVANKAAIFVFTSPNQPPNQVEANTTNREKKLLQEIHDHIDMHGDAVKDVAFEVDDAKAAYELAVANGANGVQPPTSMHDDNGEVVTATVEAFGDCTHTFVERRNYRGSFLPGYRSVDAHDPVNECLPTIEIQDIDHCVSNQDW